MLDNQLVAILLDVISLMTSLFPHSNTNIKNGNDFLRHRRICELCSSLNKDEHSGQHNPEGMIFL